MTLSKQLTNDMEQAYKEAFDEFDKGFEVRGNGGFFWENGNLNPDALIRYVHEKFLPKTFVREEIEKQMRLMLHTDTVSDATHALSALFQALLESDVSGKETV